MLVTEIQDFLSGNGIFSEPISIADTTFLGIEYETAGRIREIYILPAEIFASSPEEAEEEYRTRTEAKKRLAMSTGNADSDIVIVAEDRWRRCRDLYEARLLAHCGKFRSVFARNCEAIKTDKATANAFLDKNHSYGAAQCRYCYGLTEKRSGNIVGAATFSNARRWVKGGREIRSYEWIRYASAGSTRIVGGMGKILSAFIKDIRPDDIMSYADMEWSDGSVYRSLGFHEDGRKKPVLFEISPDGWERKSIKKTSPATDSPRETGCHSSGAKTKLWYMNEGSVKYRLKLTDYQD